MVEVNRKPGGTISHVETGRQPKQLGSGQYGGVLTNDEWGSSHAHRMHRWGNRLNTIRMAGNIITTRRGYCRAAQSWPEEQRTGGCSIMVGDGVTTDRAGEMKHGSRAGTLITVFVLTLHGRTLTVELTDETKVREIKLCLRNKLGIPVDDQRLVYGGKLPMDSKTRSKGRYCCIVVTVVSTHPLLNSICSVHF